MNENEHLTVSTDRQVKGIDATVLENRHLRLVVLQGKGGDIIELRDKRTDIDVLWSTPHNWQPPSSAFAHVDSNTTWDTHYPGGWQQNLPIAGSGGEVSDVSYDQHGESALIPWELVNVTELPDSITVELETDLIRYPFHVERSVTLPADDSRLEIADTVTNEGEVELEYIWQEHVALGPPLIGPEATLHVPASKAVVEEDYSGNPAYDNACLEPGQQFDWPLADRADGGTADLRNFPSKDAKIHDQVYVTDMNEGTYTVENPAQDLGFKLEYPLDPFECLWYWQSFGGMEGSPHFGRSYNVGLEPTTAYPAGPTPQAQRDNGTMRRLGPGESISATVTASTFKP